MSLRSQKLWHPSKVLVETSEIVAFVNFLNSKYSLQISPTDYQQLYSFSISEISLFWKAVWEFVGVISSNPFSVVVDESAPIDSIPVWFSGATFNYAENIIVPKCLTDLNRIAIIGCGESGHHESITRSQLLSRVGQCSRALASAGVTVGDRVAAYVPNSVDSAIYMLATASLGAIWSSASPDFGVSGVLDRFKQVSPKILISSNAVEYNGKIHSNIEKLKQIVQGLKSLEKVVLFSFMRPATRHEVDEIPKCVASSDWLANFKLEAPKSFAQVNFNHPLLIAFSSGTTGEPKCITHAHGALLQHLKEHRIHGSMRQDDVFFYYTTTGWMMWNWLLAGLGTGATVVLYDGSPFKPTPGRLWELVEKYKISHFGVSAKYLQSLEESGIHPKEQSDLSTLKMVYSTGSPLKPESFDYVYNHINSNVCLGSITGGTDIISLFCGHNITSPVYRGEIQCISLGMAIEAWDDDGKPILDSPGDLVCVKAFPVMPVFFWNDPTGEKYKNAYFTNFKGVWYHGDYLQINSNTGGVVMLGRSDGTLNPAGVRFGSSELYNIMAEFPQVQDSLAVGQKQGLDERVVLFCKMAKGHSLDAKLIDSIKTRIRTLLSARHVPAIILPIAEIPYTLTGKKVEVAVKKIINGQKVVPSSSIANPEALELYYGIRELTNSSL